MPISPISQCTRQRLVHQVREEEQSSILLTLQLWVVRQYAHQSTVGNKRCLDQEPHTEAVIRDKRRRLLIRTVCKWHLLSHLSRNCISHSLKTVRHQVLGHRLTSMGTVELREPSQVEIELESTLKTVQGETKKWQDIHSMLRELSRFITTSPKTYNHSLKVLMHL